MLFPMIFKPTTQFFNLSLKDIGETTTSMGEAQKHAKDIKKLKTAQKDSEVIVGTKLPSKTKLIQKAGKVRQQPRVKDADSKVYYFRSIQRPLLLTEFPGNASKRQLFTQTPELYDWMMEVASLLEITRNSFFRAVVMLQKAYKRCDYILMNWCVLDYACASLTLSAKIQNSRINFVDAIRIVVGKVQTEAVVQAEAELMNILSWNIPTIVYFEQNTAKIYSLWDKFISEISRNSKQDGARLRSLKIESNTSDYKMMAQIDIVANTLAINYPQALCDNKFEYILLMSICVVTGVFLGDTQLSQDSTWELLSSFLQNCKSIRLSLGRIREDTHEKYHRLQLLTRLMSIPTDTHFEMFANRKSIAYLPRNY